tara:strand:- start:916 stop:1107 length:192 start_codon:yes stop_codon:yes gene_type:complete
MQVAVVEQFHQPVVHPQVVVVEVILTQVRLEIEDKQELLILVVAVVEQVEILLEEQVVLVDLE